MKHLFIIIALLTAIIVKSQTTDWTTHYEKSACLETPRYKETIDYCKKLQAASNLVHYTSFGLSAQGRELPLVIVDRQGFKTVEQIKNSGRLVLLVQCGIHSGESEGKDAMMMLIRDMVISGKNDGLLDKVSLLWIPIFNVDGHEEFGPFSRINQNGPKEMGQRTTAQNLNLNRDYMKADTPEMKAWLKMFNHWLPDFFIDSHTTDGADYQYALTYGIELFGNLDPAITAWEDQVWEPFITQQMDAADFPVFPYVSFRNWHNPKSGLISGVATPRFSTGYATIQNRPAVLIETHMLKPYKNRVESTMELVRLTMELMNQNHQQLKQLVSEADQNASSAVFRQQPFPLAFKVDQTDSVKIAFKGVSYDIIHSDLTGGNWFQYSDIPETFELFYFKKNNANTFANLPAAYIIPPEWAELTEIMLLHGINCSVLTDSVTLTVNTGHFTKYDWQKEPYEGRHPMTTIELTEDTATITYPPGSAVVVMNQRTARVIAHLLEPKGPDSFVRWGFLDAVFEQKEYAETYVMEPLARHMLADNPQMQQEFDDWKKANPQKAADQWGQLNWFFMKTPYWDKQKDLYPVGKIMDEKIVSDLNLLQTK